jgi:hypothetical protein
MNVPMDLVPELFGGVIPTDVQGLYRAGTPAVATAVDAPYYHTVEDTPDKVDLPRLEETVDGFDRAIDLLMEEPPERFAARDSALWRVDVRANPDGDALRVDVVVRDDGGQPQAGAVVEAVLFHDHFFQTDGAIARASGDGTVTLRIDRRPEAPGPRFLHVTAGERHPLVEQVLCLDALG